MNNLYDRIKYEIDFIEKSYHLDECGEVYEDGFFKKFRESISQNKKKLLLVNKHEIFHTKEYLDKIYSLIDSHNDIEIYISAATSTQLKNFLHPISSLKFWKNSVTRKNINWFSKNIFNFRMFNSFYFINISK